MNEIVQNNDATDPKALRRLFWAGLPEEILVHAINKVGPDTDVHAGRNFLLALLKRVGKENVGLFIDKAKEALSEEGSLDLAYDFTAVERETFKRAALNHISRAEFFGIHGWAWPGAVAAVTGLLDYFGYTEKNMMKTAPVTASAKDAREQLIDDVAEAVIRKLDARREAETAPATKISDTIKHYLGPSMEILIGLALLEEARKSGRELKLEQISDMVSQVADELKDLKKIAEELTLLAEKEKARERGPVRT